MSTSPDTSSRGEDRIVNLLSRWLAGHAGRDELGTELGRIGTDGLSPDQAEAVAELRAELAAAAPSHPGELEVLVRETLEAVALG